MAKADKSMATVTLDFTGLYYSVDIDFDVEDDPTVEEITQKAVGEMGKTGGELIMAKFSDRGFLSEVMVNFYRSPQSRQTLDGNPFPGVLPAGVYGFKDDTANPVPGVDVSFSLGWQYYIFRNNKLISIERSGRDTRAIVPSGESNTEFQLENKDLIRWRLIAIGGLADAVFNAKAEMSPHERKQFELEAKRENRTTRELFRKIA